MNGSEHHQNKASSGTTLDLSSKFQRGAIRFIIFSAVPYMAQIVFFGAMNMYSYNCFRDDLHRTVRLTEMFQKDGSRFVATSSLGANQYSPGCKYTIARNKNIRRILFIVVFPHDFCLQDFFLIFF